MSEEKKLVSYCMVTYNEERFVAEALQAAFDQTYEPMEIIICDDHSTDKTFSVIQEIIKGYNGSKKIVAVQNEKNLGVRENYNKVLYELAKGDYIIFADGDDISTRDRTEKYVECFEKNPDIMSVSCLSDEVDENLKTMMPENFYWSNSVSIYTLEDYLQNPELVIYSGDSRGLRKSVIDSFPPVEFAPAEDMTLFIRSLLLGSGCYIRTPYVKRRHHGNNVSGKPMKKESQGMLRKQLETDINLAIDKKYIDISLKEKLLKKINLNEKQFAIYYVSAFSGLKPFFYRVLYKLFKVKICR